MRHMRVQVNHFLGRPPPRPLDSSQLGRSGASQVLRNLKFENMSVQVFRCVLIKHQTSNIAPGSYFTAQRCLTRTKRTHQLCTDSLLGKCAVIATDTWRARADVQNGDVYGAEPTLYHTESLSSSQHTPRQLKRPRRNSGATLSQSTPDLSRVRTKLHMLDVFCGAGGMSQGWVRAGVAEIVCGVDVSPSACKTFQ